MKNLSWYGRGVILVVGVIILALVFLGIYYAYIRYDRNRPYEFEVYPGVEQVVEEKLSDNEDHFQYLGRTEPNNTENYARQVQRFYTDQGFVCQSLIGDVYENARLLENVYVWSRCVVDRSHGFGVNQTVVIVIQPERTPVIFRDNNPQNEIVGGGELTGVVVIDVQRAWGTYNAISVR
jgi:hypothetical protein